MSAFWSRYWHGLSPALRRYYRASLWPTLLFIATAFVHKWATEHAGLPLRTGLALVPVACLGWLFACYLRFLRDCDELERRIELHALAWAAGIGTLGAMAALFVLDAGLATWPAKKVAGVIALLLCGGYTFARAMLHRRYP